MKRRNAIVPGLVFLLMLAGYVAWCWRPLYLGRTFAYESSVPPDAIPVVEKWRKQQPSYRPRSFHVRTAIRLLGQPWKPPSKTRVFFETNWDTVIVDSKSHPFARAAFKKVDGQWQLQPYIP